jgi:hypothetical protein
MFKAQINAFFYLSMFKDCYRAGEQRQESGIKLRLLADWIGQRE